jgi:hypothetical protein
MFCLLDQGQRARSSWPAAAANGGIRQEFLMMRAAHRECQGRLFGGLDLPHRSADPTPKVEKLFNQPFVKTHQRPVWTRQSG